MRCTNSRQDAVVGVNYLGRSGSHLHGSTDAAQMAAELERSSIKARLWLEVVRVMS